MLQDVHDTGGGGAKLAGDTWSGDHGLEHEETLIFERRPHRCLGCRYSGCGFARPTVSAALSETEPIGLAGLSEPEAVRHYVRLSQRNACNRRQFLSARILHDEAQSAAEREARAACRVCGHPPASASENRAGRAPTDRGACALAQGIDRHAGGGHDAKGGCTW